jgi:N6-L-threonylcarbamoyladenine synthase
MMILGIETSCDETAAAVVEDGRRIVSNVVASSAKIHEKYGGIVPEVAARKQIEAIFPVIKESMGKQSIEKIDALAVTVGPGLVGSLLVGIETAKTLSLVWEKSLIGVNHLVGHLYAAWINQESEVRSKELVPEFPAVGLVASGGHTDLVLMKGHGKLKHLGGTRDDAAGEAFDKIGRMLGLGYPGGPAIAAAAATHNTKNLKQIPRLPRPMIDSDDYDFSFSGLKTAVIRLIVKQKNINEIVPALAYETQEAISEVLVKKVMRAVEGFHPKSVILAGGVAANNRLRQLLKSKVRNSKLKVSIFIPPPNLCTDNAAYIAACAFYNYSPSSWKKIQANPGLEIIS